jgi:glycosidase
VWPEGTFAGVTARLPELAALGVGAVELMPVADFPGTRNWGYDGVALFAPARCYGTPEDLRRLVDTAHALGLGVFLDVVHNHLGGERLAEPHASTLRLYQALLNLRRREAALHRASPFQVAALDDATIAILRDGSHDAFLVIARLRGAGVVDFRHGRFSARSSDRAAPAGRAVVLRREREAVGDGRVDSSEVC